MCCAWSSSSLVWETRDIAFMRDLFTHHRRTPDIQVSHSALLHSDPLPLLLPSLPQPRRVRVVQVRRIEDPRHPCGPEGGYGVFALKEFQPGTQSVLALVPRLHCVGDEQVHCDSVF